MSVPNLRIADLAGGLKQDWCDSFDVVQIGESAWTLATPFVMPDGDGFVVVLERVEDGWTLSDKGITASRAFADVDFTTAAEQRFHAAASLFDLTLNSWHLSVKLSEFPTAMDVGRFLRATMAAYVAPDLHVAIDREDEFRLRLRDAIVSQLQPGVSTAPNWAPPQDDGKLYPTDLRIEAPERPVLVFAVGTDHKASLTALSVGKYREWGVLGVPFAAVRPAVGSKAVARLQDALGDDRVERMDPRDRFTINRAFRDLGVPMVAA